MPLSLFKSSHGSQLGVNDNCCFFFSKNLDTSSFESGLVNIKDLGENGVVIPFDKIAKVEAIINERAPVLISAKGMGADIGIQTSSKEEQMIILETINKNSGNAFTLNKGQASIMQTAGKTIIFAFVIIILTVCGTMAAIQANSGIDISSSKSGLRGLKENAFADIVQILGVGGTLGVGCALTAIFSIVAFIKLKNKPEVFFLKKSPK
jgi:hypothetical protein